MEETLKVSVAPNTVHRRGKCILCILISCVMSQASDAQNAGLAKDKEAQTLTELKLAKQLADKMAAPGSPENILLYQRAAVAALPGRTARAGQSLTFSGKQLAMMSRPEIRAAFTISPYIWRPTAPVKVGQFRSVVELIGYPSGSSGPRFCTGTFIGKHAVLTAAHCSCELGPIMSVVVDSIPTAIVGTVVNSQVTDCATFNAASDADQRTLLEMYGDLAVISLTRDLSTNGIQAAVLGSPVSFGSFYTIVGYGLTDTSPDTPGTKESGRIVSIACTAQDSGKIGCRPDAEFWGGGESIPGDSLITDACSGDSGGPVLSVTGGGAPFLVGVISRPVDGADRCGEGSIYEALNGQAIEWIKNAIKS